MQISLRTIENYCKLAAFLSFFSQTWTEIAKFPTPFQERVKAYLSAYFLDHKLGTSLKLFLVFGAIAKSSFLPTEP